jgi:hypothetical protein
MYVLVSNGRVLNGPRAWSFRSFQNTLQEELDITYNLPLAKTDNAVIHINDTVKIYPAVLDDSAPHNSKTQYLDGPYWDFSNDIATGTFTPKYHDLEHLKLHLKSIVAANRYVKEIAGIQHTIRNTQVTVETDRSTRNIFFQKYLLMTENESVTWKFPETWLALSKTELGTVVSAAATHIENQFIWESNKIFEIESATNHSELDSIALE